MPFALVRRMTKCMKTIDWMDQQWQLLADRAVHWPAEKTTIIADPHLGKSAAFRHLGVPVPEATTGRDLARLTRIIETTRCETLVVLGDLLHARHGRAECTMAAIERWRNAHRSLTMINVRGNHDHAAGDPPPDWDFGSVDEPLTIEGIELRHHPPRAKIGARSPACLAGHVHPCIRLRDADGSSIRAPCFLFGSRLALLPAFGSFTGSHPCSPTMGDRIFAIGSSEVVEVPTLCRA